MDGKFDCDESHANGVHINLDSSLPLDTSDGQKDTSQLLHERMINEERITLMIDRAVVDTFDRKTGKIRRVLSFLVDGNIGEQFGMETDEISWKNPLRNANRLVRTKRQNPYARQHFQKRNMWHQNGDRMCYGGRWRRFSHKGSKLGLSVLHLRA